jgi:hypothetical protein
MGRPLRARHDSVGAFDPHARQVPPDPLSLVLERLAKQDAVLRTFLATQVETLDTRVFEHGSMQVPSTAYSGKLVVQPQTTQKELIEGYAAWFTTPGGSSYTLGSVLVTIGPFVFNTVGGANQLGWLLDANEARSFAVTSDNNADATAFGAALTLNLVLWGRTIPATLGEALH